MSWQRLDPRTAASAGVLALGTGLAGGVPTLVGIGPGDPSFRPALVIVVLGILLVVAVAAGAESLRLARTRFRVGPERVELHGGLVVRTRRGLARERIRSVEITAGPVLRALGLAVVRIGTGISGGDKPVELRAIRRADAESLRGELLRAVESGSPVLARWDPAWLRYAPWSVLTVPLGLVVPGALLEVSDWVGMREKLVRDVGDEAMAMGVPVAVAVAVAVVLVLGTLTTVALRAESWWHLRVERDPGGTVRVRRGLLTLRSTSLEGRRVHGVVVAEPLGARLAGAARLDAVATGLTRSRDDDRWSDPKELLPAAPRGIVARVAADVLDEPLLPSRAVAWRAHPEATRRRRITWAVAAALLPAIAAAPFAPVLALFLAVAGVGGGWAWGRAAHATLGHGIVGSWLVVRAGVVCRRTVVLRRAGVIGWSVTRTPTQHRVGLVTLWFTTSAGDGRYAVRDVSVAQALTLVDEVIGRVGRAVPVPDRLS